MIGPMLYAFTFKLNQTLEIYLNTYKTSAIILKRFSNRFFGMVIPKINYKAPSFPLNYFVINVLINVIVSDEIRIQSKIEAHLNGKQLRK